MTDLATLRGTHATGLTGRERREVVVVHVALVRLGAERVEQLLHLEHVQRGDAQDLGLATLEQRGAVRARHDLHLRRQCADVGQAAAVDAHLVAQHALAHLLLGHGTKRGADLARAALELLGQGSDQLGLDLGEAILARQGQF